MTVVNCPQCGAKNRVDERRSDLQPVCGKCGARLSIPASADSANGHPLEVSDASFADQVLAATGKPILVDCWAPWCGPCRMIAPTIEQLAAESNGRWTIAKLNVDENPHTAQEYQIDGIPTMLLFQNGRLVDRIVGLQPKGALEAKLARAAGT